MSDPSNNNEAQGIRSVLIAGPACSVVMGMLFLLIQGLLWEAITLNPLALIGALLGLGLVGAIVGNISGMGLRMLLRDESSNDDWQIPVIAAGAASALVGLMITHFLAGLLW